MASQYANLPIELSADYDNARDAIFRALEQDGKGLRTA
jgi:hypothetical protein